LIFAFKLIIGIFFHFKFLYVFQKRSNPADGVRVIRVNADFVTDQKASCEAFMDANIIVVKNVRIDVNLGIANAFH
jgi:hypothetical protein